MARSATQQASARARRGRGKAGTSTTKGWSLPVWAAALLVTAAAFAILLGVRGGDFVWDDQILLVEWPYYRDASLFGEAIMRNLPFSPNYFRPVAALTFFLNHLLHGPTPLGYRLTNVVIHALSSLLAYLVIRRLLVTEWAGRRATSGSATSEGGAVAQTHRPLREWLALGLGLLFAWHPVHVEAVALVVGRFDLLSGLFVLLGLYLGTMRARSAGARAALAVGVGLSFLLALGSKEMAITLPLMLLALDAFRRVDWRRRWPVYVALVVAGAVYLAVRVVGLGYLFQSQPGATLDTGNALSHLLLVGRTLSRLLLLLVWPFGRLSPVHFTALPVSVADPWAWVETIVVLLLVGWLVWALVRRDRTAWLWLAFGISLLPVANILPLELRGGSFVAERFLYLPSALFFLAAGGSMVMLWARLRRWIVDENLRVLPLVGPAVGILFLAGCAASTVVTIPRWTNDRSLWEWAAEQSPESSLPSSNLAREALADSNWELALEYANRARALDPDDATAHNNAGSALLNTAQAAEAEQAFRRAISLQSENPLYWTNLASAIASQGRLEEATALLEAEALDRDPSFGPALALAGALYLNLGQAERAVVALEAAQEVLPDPVIVRTDLAKALLASGQALKALDLVEEGGPLAAKDWVTLGDQLATSDEPEAAARAYEKALQVNSEQGGLDRGDLVLLQVQRSGVYQALGDLGKAEEAAIAAMMSDLSSPLAHKAMGDVLRAQGSLVAAQKSYERALELAPGIASLTFDLGEVLLEQGKLEEARQKFSLYLELSPTGAFAERAREYLER